MKYFGLAEYLSDAWNWLDLLHLLVYLVYFIVRLIAFQEKNVIPTETMKPDDQPWMVFWVVMHTAMFLLIIVQIMFFMRVSDSFASLVKLVGSVIGKVRAFTLFFVMWSITVCLLFDSAGIKIVSEDYTGIVSAFALFIQNFRNSIGDINPPSADYWTGDNGETGLVGMAYWGWCLFLLQEFFMLIILLNFLIAIISQSYEEVMS